MEQQRSGIPSFEARAELSMELLHATEAAALACAGLLGKGDPDRVSDAAGHAMRGALERSGLTGTVALSPRHQAHLPLGLAIEGGARNVDLCQYPVDGASRIARGHINPASMLGAVVPGCFVHLPAVS